MTGRFHNDEQAAARATSQQNPFTHPRPLRGLDAAHERVARRMEMPGPYPIPPALVNQGADHFDEYPVPEDVDLSRSATGGRHAGPYVSPDRDTGYLGSHVTDEEWWQR